MAKQKALKIKGLKRLRRQTRKLLKAQKKLAKSVGKPAMPILGAGALLAALAWLGQRLGLGPTLQHALDDLRERLSHDEGAQNNGHQGRVQS